MSSSGRNKKCYTFLQETFMGLDPKEAEAVANHQYKQSIETKRFTRSKSGRFKQSIKKRSALTETTFVQKEEHKVERTSVRDITAKMEALSLPQHRVEYRL